MWSGRLRKTAQPCLPRGLVSLCAHVAEKSRRLACAESSILGVFFECLATAMAVM